MRTTQPTMADPLAAGIKPVVVTVLRMIASSWLVFLAYYNLPVQNDEGKSDVPFLLLHVLIFAALVAVQIPVITRSRRPGLRALEATVLTVLIYLTLFARIYLSAAFSDHAAFSELLTRTRALYFTVTIFATVGFGDIVATTEASRVLVTVQMLLNLVMLGVVIRVLITAGSRGMERRRSGEAPPRRSLPTLRRRRAAEPEATQESPPAAPPDQPSAPTT